MGVLSRGCWIVVADVNGAMILENVGTVAEPDLRVIDRINAPAIPVQTAITESQAAFAGEARVDMEVTDRALLSHVALAAMIAARLSREAARGMLQRLAIAAPPVLLTAIRDRLDDDLRRKLFLVVPKEMTKEPLVTIGAIIQDEIRRPA